MTTPLLPAAAPVNPVPTSAIEAASAAGSANPASAGEAGPDRSFQSVLARGLQYRQSQPHEPPGGKAAQEPASAHPASARHAALRKHAAARQETHRDELAASATPPVIDIAALLAEAAAASDESAAGNDAAVGIGALAASAADPARLPDPSAVSAVPVTLAVITATATLTTTTTPSADFSEAAGTRVPRSAEAIAAAIGHPAATAQATLPGAAVPDATLAAPGATPPGVGFAAKPATSADPAVPISDPASGKNPVGPNVARQPPGFDAALANRPEAQTAHAVGLDPGPNARAEAMAAAPSAIARQTARLTEAKLTEINSAVQGLVLTPPASGVAANLGGQSVNAPSMQGRLDAPFNTPAWGRSLGQQISWMVSGAHQSAELQLHPQDLGPVQVVLSVENRQAELFFVAREPAVREALEAALPRLREMFAQSGIELGQASVSAEQRNDSPQAHDNPRRNPQNRLPDLPAASPRPVTQRGMIDTFA